MIAMTIERKAAIQTFNEAVAVAYSDVKPIY
jgi:hypothetical protein